MSMSFYDCGLDEFPLPFFYLGPPRFCDFWDKLGLGVFVWACVHAWLNLGPLCGRVSAFALDLTDSVYDL